MNRASENPRASDAPDWIVSDEALDYLDWAMMQPDDGARLTVRLRKPIAELPNLPSLSQEQAAEIATLVELRRRAIVKFPQAERMWFTRRLLEQSTDALLAEYKAMRFQPAKQVVDVCCGIGGDLIALASAEAGRLAHGVDRDATAIAMTRRNLAAAQQSATLHVAAAESYLEQIDTETWVHIDPDRRTKGERTSHWEGSQPPVETLDAIRRRSAAMAIKLAPAADVPLDWSDGSQREWIGSRGECRQQVLWLGEALTGDRAQRVATNLDANGAPHSVSAAGPVEPIASAIEPQTYVIEPCAAVLAADLSHQLAQQFDMRAMAPHGGYLTSGTPPTAALFGLAACFQVVESGPFDVRKLRSMLGGYSMRALEIKRRGLPETPDQIRKRLKWKPVKGGSAGAVDRMTLIVTRLPERRAVAMLCRRLTRPILACS